MMAKLVLGLDIGISSVGWGIIDEESGNVIDAGVRLLKKPIEMPMKKDEVSEVQDVY